MSRKRGLGRGLDALIPSESHIDAQRDSQPLAVETDTEAQLAAVLTDVSIDLIQPNPHQPRVSIDEDGLKELARSIREHGLIQPLIVTRLGSAPDKGSRFQLIAGERRWRAARRAGMSHVPVIVKETTPQDLLALALVENVQRSDLNPLEEAMAYRQLIDEFDLTQEQVAEQVGKSRVAIANTVRLLQASAAVKDALLARKIHEGHARALLTLQTDEAQEAGLAAVLKQGLNVRQTEALVRRLSGERKEQPDPTPASPQTRALENTLRETLGTKVSLQRSRRGTGRVVIHFFSDEELQHICEQIVGDSLGDLGIG